MVTLCKTVCLYPHDLLEEEFSPESDRNWWVVYTKSRQEKAFCRQLLGLGIPHYLPLVTKMNCIRGRRFSSDVPLFASYVFMQASEAEKYTSLTTNRISRILHASDQAKLRFDLGQIQRLIASGAPLTIEERLAPGQRVKIRNGPFAGLEGTVIERRAGRRLFVGVDFLQQGASIDIEDFRLEPLT